jgi:long-chain acyl-CoA synthetase
MLYERWREVARTFPDSIALREASSGRQWTFRELESAGEQESTGPAGCAFPQGVSPEFILCLLRAWRSGQVVCPLEQPMAPDIDADLPDGAVHLKMTSATTGSSRMIVFTADQLIADAENVVSTMGLRRDWPNLGVISLAHSYGFSNLVLPLVLHGIPLILVSAPLPEVIRNAASGQDAVTLAAVPALWRTWHDAEAIPDQVRLAISAGAPLPVALEQKIFAARGLKLHNFYGSSECGGIAYDATQEPRTDASCVGTPMRNVDLSVDAEGCLQVRSAAVGMTYWPQANGTLQDGVFRTSDLARITDGQVFLLGRSGDQINIAGRKVSPETIEKALAGHPGVRDCLVFGVPVEHGDRSEIIVACVVPGAGAGADNESLRQFLLSQLPAWQVPREWWRVDSLGVNQRGKLSRTEWRRRFLQSHGPDLGAKRH